MRSSTAHFDVPREIAHAHFPSFDMENLRKSSRRAIGSAVGSASKAAGRKASGLLRRVKPTHDIQTSFLYVTVEGAVAPVRVVHSFQGQHELSWDDFHAVLVSAPGCGPVPTLFSS